MKSISDLCRDFDKAKRNLQTLNNDVPRIIGVIAVKTTRDNFNKQGFDSGFGVSQWQKRSPNTDKSYSQGRKKKGKSRYKGSVFSASNPILVQTGNLKNGVTYKVSGKTVYVGVNLKLVPYAKIHNEGGMIKAFGKFMVKMPRRKFIGFSQKLDAAIKKEVDVKIKSVFQSFT
jgi:phage gpG-like protein